MVPFIHLLNILVIFTMHICNEMTLQRPAALESPHIDPSVYLTRGEEKRYIQFKQNKREKETQTVAMESVRGKYELVRNKPKKFNAKQLAII